MVTGIATDSILLKLTSAPEPEVDIEIEYGDDEEKRKAKRKQIAITGSIIGGAVLLITVAFLVKKSRSKK